MSNCYNFPAGILCLKKVKLLYRFFNLSSIVPWVIRIETLECINICFVFGDKDARIATTFVHRWHVIPLLVIDIILFTFSEITVRQFIFICISSDDIYECILKIIICSKGFSAILELRQNFYLVIAKMKLKYIPRYQILIIITSRDYNKFLIGNIYSPLVPQFLIQMILLDVFSVCWLYYLPF